MDKIIISILIISVASVTLYFVIEDAMSEPVQVVKKTWYFVPVECWSITEVKYSNKLIGNFEPFGCGVYSSTIDDARAVSRDELWKLEKGIVEVNFSMCTEPKGGYRLNFDQER